MELYYNKRSTPQAHHASAFGPCDCIIVHFLFWWLKGELASRSGGEISEFLEVIDKIINILATETIARSFSNWIERLKEVINIDGDYI
jgi:hypothetical protein